MRLSFASVRTLQFVVLVAALAGAPGVRRAAAQSQGRPAARPSAAKAPVNAERARMMSAFDSIVSGSRFRNAQWGMLIVDPERGDTLYSHNAGKLFLPASNEKVITAATALALLGPDFRFTTRIAMSGTVQDSVLDGNLVVFGSGDPSFSDRIRGSAMLPLRELADSIKAHGIKRVNGELRRGKPVFTDSPIGFGWAWDDLNESYGATVGDLMYNDVFTQVKVAIDGVPDSATTRPPFRNFLDAFHAALREQDVHVLLSWNWTPVPDTGLKTLFEYRSAPLRELLPYFLKSSQNQIGEILLKTIGLVRTGVGRSDSGAKAVARTLVEWGADSSGFIIRDGSGLSRHDYVSPETLVRVLDAMHRDSLFTAFYDAFPVAGIDGTLDRRMRGTSAQDNARAKTGSMDRVRALSGYVTTSDKRLLIYSLIANGWTVPGPEVEAVLDSIVARLARLKTGS